MSKIPKRLLFDVSTHLMYIGYARGDQLKDFSIRIAQRDHAKYLIDRIDQMLKRNKLTLDRIDEIIIGVGPGSYTGLRIAVMVGKMLAYTKNMPLKTVSSLFFLTSGYQGRIAAMTDARRGNVFSAVYENGAVIMADQLRPFAEFSQTEAYQSAEAVFISERHYEVSVPRILERAVLVEDVHNLVPNYLRITEAEANEHQKSKT
ncbi:MAG: tRNA (adenosine(37)-N6)-threonylcarbamoyltransferase complex dimerization subunit type 1 TsaB [Acholeplasmataceae bacterium]|nr:MAG: tRNA (adenosine(37)-N6)-threonylcarbamoyltransferase complex dimerization subunit type 1 TsaB [Acholeplasmataceae bacterium]